MIDDKEDIPISITEQDAYTSSIRLRLQTELKVRLYVALKEAGLTRADLVRRLGWKRESVDRLFRLDHNSRIDQLEMAFNAIGHDIHVDLEPKQAAA